MNSTVKVDVPNTTAAPTGNAKDASVAQAFPTTPKNIDSIPADDMPKDDTNEDLESQVDEILGGLDDDSAGLLKD